MTAKDTKGILALLQSEYPLSFSKMDERMMAAKVNLWAEEFAEDDPHLVWAAVKAIIAGEDREFAPNVGHIKNKMHSLAHPGALTENEAWALVSKAASNATWHGEEEFAKLPPEVRRAVGSVSQLKQWALMDEETVQSVIASNFMRSYRTIMQREKENAMLPESVRTLLGGVAAKLALAEAET